MREYNATVGATDGNIIAAIITTQTPTNQPRVPRSVHGPPSMPCISRAVHHQPTIATARSNTMSRSRLRAAHNAGASLLVSAVGSWAEAINRSGGPRERGRKSRLALVLDSERADLRARRLGCREFGGHRGEDARQACRLSRFDAEGHDVLNLEIDSVTDPNAVA